MAIDGGVWAKVWPDPTPPVPTPIYANFTDTPTGTYTDGDGVDWKYVSYTSSGTVTFDQAGYMSVLVVGGGLNASLINQWPSSNSAGAAGMVRDGQYETPAVTYTITVGAPATKPATAGVSSIGTFVVAGGGMGADAYAGGSPSNHGIASAITGTNLEYSYQNNFPIITGSGYGVASQVNQITGATQGIVIMAVRV